MAIAEPQIGTVRDLASRMTLLRNADGLAPITFIIGAGCSVTAGIMSASDIAKSEVKRLCKQLTNKFISDPAKALIAVAHSAGYLKGHYDIATKTPDQLNWGQIYDALFAEVHTSPTDVSKLFKATIKNANPKINWAHLALGELARNKWIATTITTNFDLLALEGYARAGVIPVVSDGIESLYRIDPRPDQPQLLQINGSVHSYRMRNSQSDLKNMADSPEAVTCFRNIYQASDLIVIVGYDGREPQIMDLLTQAAQTFGDKHIYWCLHSQDPAKLSDNAKKFMSYSTNARLILGQDADLFFHSLSQELNVHAPLAFRDPIGFLEHGLSNVFTPDPANQAVIAQELTSSRDKLEKLRDCDTQTLAKAPLEPPSSAKTRKKTPAQIAAFEIDKLRQQHGSTGANLFDEILKLSNELDEQSRGTGDQNTLETSLALAKMALDMAETSEQKGRALSRKAWSLLLLGEMHVGQDQLIAAVNAFETALQHLSQSESPLHWAFAQNGLGNALSTLGQQTDSIDLLERAEAAFHVALSERTQTRVPLEWASTQNNLGNALSALGMRDQGTARLGAAVAAYTAALEEYTQTRAPLDWAMTQNNLGVAMAALGEREEGTARLEAAVAAYTAALKERTQTRVPVYWADTQLNLSLAEVAFFDKTADPSHLVAARDFALAAREGYMTARAGHDVGMADNLLAQITAREAG